MANKRKFIKRVWNRLRYSKLKIYVLEHLIRESDVFPPLCEHGTEKWNAKITNNMLDLIQIMSIDCQESANKYLAIFDKRLQRGDNCWVLYINERPASYLWTGWANVFIETLRYNVKLENDVFAVYDGYTKNDYRRRGCFVWLLHEIMASMAARGYAKLILWVMKHNVVAIKTHIRCGFDRVIMEMAYVSFAGFIFHKKTNVDYPAKILINE